MAAATRFPHSVLCLISALDCHGITTQIPHQIHLAVERDARLPVLDYPPVAGYRFSGRAFSAGIDRVDVDGIVLNVYNPEKTLADGIRQNLPGRQCDGALSGSQTRDAGQGLVVVSCRLSKKGIFYTHGRV